MDNITTESTIQKSREICSRLGIRQILLNDCSLMSQEIRRFFESIGITNEKRAPYHSATNEEV